MQIVTELKKLSPYSIDKLLDQTENEFTLRHIMEQDERMLMNWDEVKEMSNAGISFGSHCVNHSILTNLSSEEKYYEITSSRQTLLNKGINYVDCISFPNGNYDQETLDIATKAGYKLMLTASINKCGEGISPLLAHRIGISKTISEDNNLIVYSILKAKLKGKLYSPLLRA
jgi:peptidoglycan/xylan/chitin deacetylase (PgdA/CDA1 family)